MSKRILSLVLALVMVLGTFGTVFAAETGSDKIDWLVEQGIVKGDASGNLMLDKNIDRASVAKMVVEALGQQAAAAGMQGVKSIFPDVPAGHWSNGNINIVNGLGLMKGNAKGQFMPSAEISYAEVVTILVRMSNGFTAEEEKAAVWPASYIAKANELGILEDITVANFSAAAVRKDILEMFYNAMINMEVGKYSVVKGIVLENYRVQKLDKDKILVEVLKEIKKADYVEESRDEKGDQITLTVPAKIGDVENLLGRVADFTVDKNNNVVAMKIDESYKVETGAFKATKNKIGSYTVDLPERYNKNDETIFRTYYNNEAYAYEDFYRNPDEKERKDDFTVDYARVTVKNGKALFIDAFNFEDIAPVKEVKQDGAEVLVYNDARNGAVKTIEVGSSAKVITFNDGKMGIGSREDIKANDVIHEFKGGFIVRKDAAVNGTFKKVSEDRDGKVYVHVDDEKYQVLEKDYKKPVYSYDSSKDFFTLEAAKADSTLKEFRDEKVTALIDMSGKLQYIGSEIELGEFVGLVTRVVGDKLRVLKADNKTYDYVADLDTKVVVDEKATGHKGLNNLVEGDLVYMSVDGENIEKVYKLTHKDSVEVTNLNSREIKLKGIDKGFRVFNETSIFVNINNGEKMSARTLKEVTDAFDKDDKDGVKVYAYVIDGKEFDKNVDPRRPEANITRDDEAHTIVFTQLTIKADTKAKVVEFIEYTDSQDREMSIRLDDGTKETRKLDKNVKIKDSKDNSVRLRGGDIIEIAETKDDNKDIKEITRLIESRDKDNTFRVKRFEGRDVVIEDAAGNTETKRIDSNTVIFGDRRNIDVKDGISYVLDKDARYIKAILNRGKVKDSEVTGLFSNSTVETGIVTYVNETRLELDRKVTHAINADTKLVKDGVTIAMGANIVTKLNINDKVTVKDNIITIVSVAGDRAKAEVVDGLIEKLEIKDEKAPTAAEKLAVAEARAAYNALTKAQQALVKTANVDKLEALEAIIAGVVDPAKELAEATAAVEKAELSKLQADVDTARALVNKLPASEAKSALLVRLNQITVVVATGVKAKGEVTTKGVDAVTPDLGSEAKVTILDDMDITAKEVGKAGNDITIVIEQATGEKKELEVSVVGKNIKVSLPTDAAANPVTVSAVDLMAAINNHSQAKELVIAENGTKDAEAVERVALSGGKDKVEAKDAVKEVYTLTITSGATATGTIVVNGTDVAVVKDMTPAMIATAIKAAVSVTDYTITVDGNKVIFTSDVDGAVTSLNITVVDK
ncbi:S-layer homology domain-containing protein [Tissierella sp.]|uniref:S-layer homology domain-containing protein n=1 Tax=Tissierella sp. TaxID=41274 RepID=UPI003059434F